MKGTLHILLPMLLVTVVTSGCTQESGEPVEIPDSIEANCIGFLIGNPEEEMQTASQIGAGWVRPHPGPFAWDNIEPVEGHTVFAETDMWVTQAQNNNLAMLGTILPYAEWDQSSCHGTECDVSSDDIFYPDPFKGGGGIPISRCMPCDMEAYKNFVSTLVERYDGDGVSDMPGLEIPVRHWEVLNEPEESSPELTFFIGTAEEYVQILQTTNEAIKSACPGCIVVQGGAQHSMEYNLGWWGDVIDLGGADYFDIANIHYITEGDLQTLNVENFKALLDQKGVDKLIWVTEAQYDSEEEVETSMEGALAAGASKIFFTQFKIGQFGVPAPGEYSSAYNGITAKCESL